MKLFKERLYGKGLFFSRIPIYFIFFPKELQKLTEDYAQKNNLTTDYGLMEENQSKNRYADFLPCNT